MTLVAGPTPSGLHGAPSARPSAPARRSRLLPRLPLAILAVDLTLLLGAVLTALLARATWDFATGPADLSPDLPLLAPALVGTWVLSLAAAGAYTRTYLEVGTEEFRRVAKAALAAAALVSTACFVIKYPLSRGLLFTYAAVAFVLLPVGRLAVRRVLYRARGRNSLLHNVLVIGHADEAERVAAVLRRDARLGYRVVGALSPGGVPGTLTDRGVAVQGSTAAICDHVVRSGVDVVFFVDGGVRSATEMRRIAWALEPHGVQVVVAPSISDVAGDRVKIRPVGGLPLIHLDPPRAIDASRWGKRLLDIVGSVAILVAASPVLLAAALAVRCGDRGPVLFRQARVGRDGRVFEVLKLRTMVVDAEARLAELRAAHGWDGGLFKLAEDPRITRVGRLLRRLSIDELPQAWNVLRGDMSLVGPRPPLPEEVAAYPVDARRRLRVRPGITGLWQVSGRSDLSTEEALRLDLYYVDNWSVLQDLSILAKTVTAVLSSRGAY
ncbi:sugar transferase [Nocardioides sp.]|uniref:sugar transferase n=1 Tax=Nocardioides sp. TaxID=35761 RepID=UPI003512DDE6